MALTVRRIDTVVAFALAAAYNLFKREMAESLSTLPHCDITSLPSSGDWLAPTSTPDIVTNADAAALPAVLLIANEAKAVYNRHIADAVAHKAADTANVVSTAAATDQGTANTLLNAIKAKINLHLAQAGVHFTNDATNTIAAADATDLASSVTLANAVKAALNAHIQFGFTSPSINLVAA